MEIGYTSLTDRKEHLHIITRDKIIRLLTMYFMGRPHCLSRGHLLRSEWLQLAAPLITSIL